MASVSNSAMTNKMADFYVSDALRFVNDVTLDDYKKYLSYIKNSDKNIIVNPVIFISYLTGIETIKIRSYYLGRKQLEDKMTKRQVLMY